MQAGRIGHRTGQRLALLLTALLFAIGPALALPAAGHEPDVMAEAVCVGDTPMIRYTISSFTDVETDAGRYNSNVDLYLDAEIAHGMSGNAILVDEGMFLPGSEETYSNEDFLATLSTTEEFDAREQPGFGETQQPSGQFSGEIDATQWAGTEVELHAFAVAPFWGGEGAGDRTRSEPIAVPTCEEEVTTTTSPPTTDTTEVTAQTVQVSVTGMCYVEGAQDFARLTVEVEPETAATVSVAGETVFRNAVIDGLPAGTSYSWTATAAEGFTLEGAASGVVEVEDCLEVGGIQVESTTTTVATTATTVGAVTASTLPFTGGETGVFAGAGVVALAAGGLVLLASRSAGKQRSETG